MPADEYSLKVTRVAHEVVRAQSKNNKVELRLWECNARFRSNVEDKRLKFWNFKFEEKLEILLRWDVKKH